MIVREDDTFVCESCYEDDLDESRLFDLPQHRWSFATVNHGVCDACGAEASA